MEENKAPDKLYYAPYGDIRENHPITDNDIEYTRTDALIEKACVKLKKLMYDNLMFQDRLHREKVIDNFVEDFKKDMKGE